MYYEADLVDSYRRVATYVDKILKGAKACRPPGRAADEVRAGDQSGKPPNKSASQFRPHVLARADRVIR